ncbi:aldose 1-epimerase [Bacillus sp. AFS017336]|uniref:aldose 1-epimerase n=1 Tax=Bacillus sp. AFS017336 TaxID=2033489 RepID=UPI000BEFF353|nr:aldose 1-epimerase [Bacillus sp. AFS017336]PEL09340.1 aldose epimerase [Bacillus sp. AFS017336]
MSTYAEEISFLDEPAIKAGNSELEIIIIPGWGSNLISMVHKGSNTELLRVPTSTKEYVNNPVLFGTPILFPPNRIDRGKFSFNDRTYQFEINELDKQNHIHGFVHTRKWEVVSIEVNDHTVKVVTEFDSSKHDDVMAQFPHHFMIRMNYILNDNLFAKKAEIINKSNESLPLGFGYHTSFLFPEETSILKLPVKKRWKLNDRFLPTGELEDIEYKDELSEGMSLYGLELDDVFLSSPNASGLQTAQIMNQSTGIEINYTVDQSFKHWVVYNKDGRSGFLCPEPYTWVTNAPNLKVNEELTGIQRIEPDDMKVLRTWIVISHKS